MKSLTELPSLHGRRSTIVGLWLTWALAVALRSPVGPGASTLPRGLAAVAALLALAALCVRNYRIGQFIADDADASLDERQIALRNRAYLGAYRLFGGLMAAGAAYITIAVDSQRFWYPASRFAWQSIAEGIILLAVVAPSAWLGWFVPDESDTNRRIPQ
jgi:hypothetical protein